MNRPDAASARTLSGAIARAHAARVPLLMGILNVTPDSFSDGGCFNDPEAALDHVRAMMAAGCDIVDIGGESTRPGAALVPADVEITRVLPVLRALAGEVTVPVSVDTTKAAVARAALGAGAAMINDVWGLQRDPEMASVVAEAGVPIVVMHNREEACEELDILDDLRRFFDLSLRIADEAGIARNRIILDPGIGFGKTDAQNWRCIAKLGWLREEYDLPVLLGVSRKSLFGRMLGRDVDARLPATLAADLVGADRGAAILRVHDVQAHADALAVRAMLAEAAS